MKYSILLLLLFIAPAISAQYNFKASEIVNDWPLYFQVADFQTSTGYLKQKPIDNIEKTFPQLLLYPNPVVDILYIQSKLVQKGDWFYIYDVLGKKVCSGQFTNHALYVDLTPLKSGVYMLKTDSIQGRAYRFIKM